MKYPIVILAKERPVQLKEMIDSIVERTDDNTYRIIVCDNGSTQPEMVEYLKSIETKHQVIYNGANNGFEGFNSGLNEVQEELFFLSDPDVVLSEIMPEHWILRFSEVMQTVMTPKLGVALDVERLDMKDEFQAMVKKRENEYWEHAGTIDIPAIDAPCYLAPVDTTLAMYRRDTYDFWTENNLSFKMGNGIAPCKQIHQNQYNKKYYVPTVRVAGRFTCRHTGWEMPTLYQSDYEYYKTNCDLDIASTTKWQTSGRRLDE